MQVLLLKMELQYLDFLTEEEYLNIVDTLPKENAFIR